MLNKKKKKKNDATRSIQVTYTIFLKFNLRFSNNLTFNNKKRILRKDK